MRCSISFVRRSEHRLATPGTEPELQLLQTIQHGANGIENVALLRQQQDTKRTCNLQSRGAGIPAPTLIIQYEQWSFRFETQGQNFLFAHFQAHQGQQRAIVHRSDFNPGKLVEFRQEELPAQACRRLRGDRPGYLNPAEKGREQVQKSDLIQVLQGRRITDDVAHLRDPY